MTEYDEFIKSLIRVVGLNLVDGEEIAYSKVLHIMEEKTELQIPSGKEVYKFNKKAWILKSEPDYLILTKR